MKRACIICGTPATGRRCPAHTPADDGTTHTGWSPYRNGTKQNRFRRDLLTRAQGRCERCGNTNDLRACHITPLIDGGTYDLSNGILLCCDCDKTTDRYAR